MLMGAAMSTGVNAKSVSSASHMARLPVTVTGSRLQRGFLGGLLSQ